MIRFIRVTVKNIANYIELFVSFLMIVVIAIAVYRTIVIEIPHVALGEVDLHYFLAHAMTFAIAVEFIKMLCEHTSETLIEVLMFAIARGMIVEHLSPINTLISVTAIAALFAIRKFLFVKFEDSDRIVFRGSQSVALTNRLAEVQLPGDNRLLLRDLLRSSLETEERTVAIGAVADFADCALRIDSMKDGQITRVEVIRSN